MNLLFAIALGSSLLSSSVVGHTTQTTATARYYGNNCFNDANLHHDDYLEWQHHLNVLFVTLS